MINSMTGFASCELNTDQGLLGWELRSVNHRYLEAQLRLPEAFRALEPGLREQLAARLLRGKVDATLQFRPAGEAGKQLRVNADLAAQLISRAESLAADCGSAVAPLNMLDVLRWPGVLEEQSPDASGLFEPVKALLDEALNALCANRLREGERIERMLTDRLQQISELIVQIRRRLPTVLEQMHLRMSERAQAIAVRIEPERLEQELLLLAQKMDVAEELDRLEAHVQESHATLIMDGAVGRRLDFLLQEFNREANTLGSKSADPETSKAAVELKVLIEQLREQVQNVE